MNDCIFNPETRACIRCGFVYRGRKPIEAITAACPAPDDPAIIANLPAIAGETCPTCPEHGLSEHGLMIVCGRDSGCACKAKPVIAMTQRLYGKRKLCESWAKAIAAGNKC